MKFRSYVMGALGAVAVVGLACAAGTVSASSAGRACSTPRYPGSGYFTSLTVWSAPCITGREVALAHYRCRVRHGRSGRCTTTVRRYTCREKRRSIATDLDAVVTCRRGGRRVVFSYQQNL